MNDLRGKCFTIIPGLANVPTSYSWFALTIDLYRIEVLYAIHIPFLYPYL